MLGPAQVEVLVRSVYTQSNHTWFQVDNVESFKFEILGLPLELTFSHTSYLPLSDVISPFVVAEFDGSHTPTYVRVVDDSFDGLHPSQHYSKKYKSLTAHPFSSEGYLFKYLTGQFLANKDFTQVKLWLPFERQMSIDHDGFENFSGDPSLRLILWARSSLEGYCYMHGALIVLDGKYVLLIGPSGSGKTTLSNLACDSGASLLTEEDPFISCKQDELHAYASPWPGMRGPEAPHSGKLTAIFYLRHAEQNSVRPLATQESCHNLLKHSRTFNWLPQTLPMAIELFDKVAKRIPSYDFGFVPDFSAINSIQEFIQ